MAPLDNTPMTKAEKLQSLEELAQKVLWLSTWTIHHANFVRKKVDGLKVGGHQASCASSVAILTALYMSALRPEDRVAVKPHASPVFHAIQYLFGHQTQENLENFRAFGGAQSYPSRTKDADDVDISTGSVGMGPAMTVFTSMVQDYLRRHKDSVAATRRRPHGGAGGRCGNGRRQHVRSPLGGMEARPSELLVDRRLQPPKPGRRSCRIRCFA